MARRRPRVLFYAAGRSGVGQTRRALRLAEYVATSCDDRGLLVVSGVASADRLFRTSIPVVSPRELPHLVNAVRDGRRERGALRSAASEAITRVLLEHRPDVLVTTSHDGIDGELRSAMRLARRRGCRTVLALRDIYHPPRHQAALASLTSREFDRVVVGGPPQLARWLPRELREGPLGGEIVHVGYLVPPTPPPGRGPLPGPERQVSCQLGGGFDGIGTALAAVRAVAALRHRGEAVRLDLSTGPLMPRRHVAEIHAEVGSRSWIDLRSWRAQDDASLDDGAVNLVMAGYNTCVEAAWSGARTVLLPRRDAGDLEQSVRAEIFPKWFPSVTTADDLTVEVLASSLTRAFRRSVSSRAAVGHEYFARPQEVAEIILRS